MTTREMHLDFKRKFNKIDSQKNRNILVPEIDLYLNEAAELFVKKVAQPKKSVGLGFEQTQRMTEDIKSIVVPGVWLPVTNNIITLPLNYLYYGRGRVRISKGTCLNQEAVLNVEEHRDLFEESSLYSSNFEWRTVNGVFSQEGINVFTDGTFTITEAKLTYIRKQNYFHNAQDFGAGSYNHPSGVTLSGTVQCELPEHTHREIVDIAVMLAASEVQTSDLQVKASKLGFNQIV
jgi:hypothetical protein